MKTKGGKFTSTISLYRGCSRSATCFLCQQCKHYDKFSAKCHECYPQDHCLCQERGMGNRTLSISQYLDKPMFDPNGDSNGHVEYHKDPMPEVMTRLNEQYERIGVPISAPFRPEGA